MNNTGKFGWREVVTILLVVMGFVLGGASVGKDLREHEELPGHPLSTQKMEFMQEDITEIRRMVEAIYAQQD
jgi:hypothetical protein